MSDFEDVMAFFMRNVEQHVSDNKVSENKIVLNDNQEQDKCVLTADGELIPASGITALTMILFGLSERNLKKLSISDFAERIVLNSLRQTQKRILILSSYPAHFIEYVLRCSCM